MSTARTILITGTTSGIGMATAKLLDARGWRVFAGVLPDEDTGALLAGASSRLTVLPLDITDPVLIADAAARIAQAVGAEGLHALHNNAGYPLTGPLEFLPLEALQQQFSVNVVGHVRVTQALLPLLRMAAAKDGGARIVNTVSVLGRIALPFTGAYSMSKFAMEAFTDALRNELAPWNIQVSAIEPGSVATPFFHRAEESMDMVRRTFSSRAEALYGDLLAKSSEVSSSMTASALPPEAVAGVVLKALTDPRPKTRYLVGREARILAFFAHWFGDRRRDRAILRQYGVRTPGGR